MKDSGENDIINNALKTLRPKDLRDAMEMLRKRDLPEIRLLILRSFTVEPLLPCLEFFLAVGGFSPKIQLGDLEQYEQGLTGAEAKGASAVMLLWRIEELLPELFSGSACLERERREEMLALSLQRLEQIVALHLQNNPSPLMVSLFYPPVLWGDSSVELHLPAGPFEAVCRLNLKLVELASGEPALRLFNPQAWLNGREGNTFDLTMELYGRQPFSRSALPDFARLLSRKTLGLFQPRKKVIAVDLDNTLWGGILGEDGIAGLKIGRDYPGNVFYRIQQQLLKWKATGILLVLVSKNNRRDVDEAFERLEEMPLKPEDFTEICCDFEPKHLHLRAAAKKLNLSTDSFVFLDDSDFEREQMRHECPEVMIVNASSDPVEMLSALAGMPELDTFRVGDEDKNRHREYRSQALRNELLESSRSTEDFLAGLKMKMRVTSFTEKQLQRVAQMHAKTNQFNLTTRRHSDEVLKRRIAEDSAVNLCLYVEDRFGDQGLVGFLSAVKVPDEPDVLEVDSFLLSCRALGRKAEEVLWARFLERANGCGAAALRARYFATTKNSVVKDLYERLGMNLEDESDKEKTYRLQLPVRDVRYPNAIQCVFEDEAN